MAVATTIDKLDGNMREVYAQKLERAYPDGVMFQKDIQFVPREQQPGNYFHQPVMLTYEHGFSYAAAGAGPFTVQDAVPAVSQDAKLLGTQMLLKTQIDYETAARASSGKPRAFEQALSVIVENMWESSRKRVEVDLLYGAGGIGVISTINTTTGVITISKATWAPGIWAGCKNALLTTTEGIAATTTTSSGLAGLTVTKVDFENRQITVTGTRSATAATDYIWFRGQRGIADGQGNNVFTGIVTALKATGVLWNINCGTYELWKPNTYSAGSGPLTFQKIQKAVAQCMGKGLDSDLSLYISPGAWADLLTDEAALRRHVQGGREAAYNAGAEGIKFFSQNGAITIKTSIYMMNGYAVGISPKLWKRVGACDLTFSLPDNKEKFFLHDQTYACYELRNYVNHAVFTKAPGKALLITDIVNST